VITALEQELHCELICPAKVLYPVCTSCCTCLIYNANQQRVIRSVDTGSDFNQALYMAEDYDKVYDEFAMEEEATHLIQQPLALFIMGVLALIGGGIAFGLKKGMLNDFRAPSMQIDVKSTRGDKKRYHAEAVGFEEKSQFPHPVFKASGDPCHSTAQFQTFTPQRPRAVELKAAPPKPVLGWKDFAREREAEERMLEEAVPYEDRLVCMDFLQGTCFNPQCLKRHEQDKRVKVIPAKTTLPKQLPKDQKEALTRFSLKSNYVHSSNCMEKVAPVEFRPPQPPKVGQEEEPSSDSGSGSIGSVEEDPTSPMSDVMTEFANIREQFSKPESGYEDEAPTPPAKQESPQAEPLEAAPEEATETAEGSPEEATAPQGTE
jgi:hypothetical protein